jgi:hypothetical protein
MKIATETPAFARVTRREGLLTLLAGALTLAGCGGGGSDVAAVGGGGTGSFSVGPISGMGSIIVNGVRFDDSLASIVDDDGAPRGRNELKLGMMVRVKGKAKSRRADNTDEADKISFGSELLGPIGTIPSSQTTPATLLVLGQNVQITASTIFEDGLAGLSALKLNDIIEVHGFVDPATNSLVATRIESKPLATVFKLQGKISSLSTANTTFKIGTLTISYAPPVDIPASLILANDLLVRVRLATTPATGTRTALRVRAVVAEVAEDRDEAEVEGTITDFTSSAKYSVNGQPVDASGVTVPAGLKVGSRVEVEGRLIKGVLMAKKVQLKDANEKREVELHGMVSKLTSTTFTVTSSGGIVANVSFTSSVAFVNGTAANLVNGAKVEVKGTASDSSTSSTSFNATGISFE